VRDSGKKAQEDHMADIGRAQAYTANRTEAVGDDLVLLVGRLMLAAIFIVSGLGKLSDVDSFAMMLTNRFGLPAGYPLAAIAAVVEFFGALAIIIGWQTRWASLGLLVFTVIAAFLAHRYWAYPPEQVTNQYNHFMKNFAIVGGLLILMGSGPGRWSIDRFVGSSRTVGRRITTSVVLLAMLAVFVVAQTGVLTRLTG
jgi:putative oxidoreductase